MLQVKFLREQNNKEINKILSSVEKNKKEIIRFTQNLVKSISANPYLPNESWKINEPIEKEVSELIYDKLKELGFNPKFVSALSNRPNIICKLKRDGKPTLIFNGHMDTVVASKEKWKFDPFSGKIIDKKLFGRGSLDMKSSLVCMIFAMQSISEIEFPGNVIFAAVVDEEPGACSEIGTKYLLKKGLKGDACIVGEPKTNVIVGHKGIYRFNIRVKGVSIHTSSLEWERKIKGVNAISKALKILAKIEKINVKHKHLQLFKGRKFVVTPTLIKGGKGINIVPNQCNIFFDSRLLPGQTNEQIKAKINEIIKDLKRKDSQFDATIEDLTFVPATFISPKEKIVRLLHKNAKLILKKEPKIKISGAACDGHFFIEKGIPAICGFGPCGENFHAENEFVYTDSLIDVTKVYALTAFEYCSGNKNV